jgi:hypothetical protein
VARQHYRLHGRSCTADADNYGTFISEAARFTLLIAGMIALFRAMPASQRNTLSAVQPVASN